MKITEIEIFKVKIKDTFVPGYYPTRVRISTDEGICGWGEAGIPVMAGREATATFLTEIAPMIIGMDPLDTEKIWSKLYHGAYWSYAGGSIVFAALSALDIACWDIKGKVAGLPVYKLLGGKTNKKLRTYASQIQLGWGKNGKMPVTPEEYAQQALNAVEEGYDCVKVDPFWTDMEGLCSSPQRIYMPEDKVSPWEWKKFIKGDQLKAVSQRVGAIRKAVGDGVDIVIEFHGLTDVNTSIQIGRELDQYGCLYYEEPNSSINERFTLALKKGVKTPVATGERIGSALGFQNLIEKRAIDVAQPDLGVVGGFTEMKKVCDLANLHDIGIQIHNMSGPILCAATLHMETAITNFVIHENLAWNTLEKFRAIGKYDYQPVDGQLIVPEIPGIGQELSEKAIAEADVVKIK
jgi:L-alanine-DL-glutamate epimerase-like enolase superfamily enzyme